MADTKPAWTAKLGSKDKTTFAKPERRTFFKFTEMPRDTVAVKVVGKIRRGDIAHQLLLQLPSTLYSRIEGAITGASGPALVALIEYALDTLDSKGLTIIVENGD